MAAFSPGVPRWECFVNLLPGHRGVRVPSRGGAEAASTEALCALQVGSLSSQVWACLWPPSGGGDLQLCPMAAGPPGGTACPSRASGGRLKIQNSKCLRV